MFDPFADDAAFASDVPRPRLLAALPQDATLWEELASSYSVDVLCDAGD